jgi:hypothetical protein
MLVFGSEIWALCFILLFQDIPFFLIRLIILIEYTSFAKNYSIYFYVAKNFCLCLFEMYRITIIYFAERNHNAPQTTAAAKETPVEDHIYYF